MEFECEAGYVDFSVLDPIVLRLFKESALFREAYQLKLVGLMSLLILRELGE